MSSNTNVVYLDEGDGVFTHPPCTTASTEPLLPKEEWFDEVLPILKVLSSSLNQDVSKLPKPMQAFFNQPEDFSQPQFNIIEGTHVVGGEKTFDRIGILIASDPNFEPVNQLLLASGFTEDVNDINVVADYLSEWLKNKHPDLVAEALMVQFGFLEDRDYQRVLDQTGKTVEIHLIGPQSGIAHHQEKYNTGFIQQLLELKAGMNPNPPTLTESSTNLTHLYANSKASIRAISGTLVDRESQVKRYFRSNVEVVDPEGEAIVTELEDQLFISSHAKAKAIAKHLVELYKNDEAALVYARQPEIADLVIEEVHKLDAQIQLQSISASNPNLGEQTILGVNTTKAEITHFVSQQDVRGLDFNIKGVFMSGYDPYSPELQRQIRGRLGGNRQSGFVVNMLSPQDVIAQWATAKELNTLNLKLEHVKVDDNGQVIDTRVVEFISDLYQKIQKRNFSATLDAAEVEYQINNVMQYLRGELIEELTSQLTPGQLTRLWSHALSLQRSIFNVVAGDTRNNQSGLHNPMQNPVLYSEFYRHLRMALHEQVMEDPDWVLGDALIKNLPNLGLSTMEEEMEIRRKNRAEARQMEESADLLDSPQ